MDKSRRSCLKKIGYTAAGLSCGIPLLDAIGSSQPAQAPATQAAPELGQMAMVIDVAGVTEEVANACIEVCHREHNVPTSHHPQREVKWLWTEHFRHAFPDQFHGKMADSYQHMPVLLLCNHCDNPACVKVCPTAATWKRTSDGIVMMDMHRCIGCRYCVVACPYGSRSFNWSDPDPRFITTDYPSRNRGVVEKCNFCAERLRVGEEPFCVVEARRVSGGHGPLTFGDLSDPGSEVSRLLRTKHTISRKNALGTGPNVYYIVPSPEEATEGEHGGSAS